MLKTGGAWMDGITTEMMEHICDDLCPRMDRYEYCVECPEYGEEQ